MATAAEALRKLTSGATLTAEEKALLNIGPAVPASTKAASDAAKAAKEAADKAAKEAADKAAKEAADKAAKEAADKAAKEKATPDPNANKVSTGVMQDENGNWFRVYTDGTKSPITYAQASGPQPTGAQPGGTTSSDPATLTLINSLQTQVANLTAAQNTSAAAMTTAAAEKKAAAEATRQSAIAILTDRFTKYGLGSLAAKIKELAVDGATEATITLGLQETEEYKQRFSANTARVKAGLEVLTPAEYLRVEDGYRQVLREYGLNQFSTDDYVKKFIENDVSAAELSNRVSMAVQRVQNADPAITKQLTQYYGIGQADLLGYVLDPQQQITKIQRQVAAAEIGVAAARQGLTAGVGVAEQLAAQGITQAEAQKGYATVADILPTAEKLSEIYGGSMDRYGQSEAEQEVFNSLASAQRKREALTKREIASFSGSSGMAKGLSSSTGGQI
jgi:hypothetical protein